MNILKKHSLSNTTIFIHCVTILSINVQVNVKKYQSKKKTKNVDKSELYFTGTIKNFTLPKPPFVFLQIKLHFLAKITNIDQYYLFICEDPDRGERGLSHVQIFPLKNIPGWPFFRNII